MLSAPLRKFHGARTADTKTVEIRGTGSPKRGFLHVHDLANVCAFLMNIYSDELNLNRLTHYLDLCVPSSAPTCPRPESALDSSQ
jgi:nucleoside-diphosphate-sugar epimerase